MKRFTLIIPGLIFCIAINLNAGKFLFDYTCEETAGNADWIIDDDFPYPSPDQSGIGDTTSETYWQGALSYWGVDLVKAGHYVETLNNKPITLSKLMEFDVFIVPEPHRFFSSSEKQAILSFVSNGGGLFIIADHNGAERGTGVDPIDVWNDNNWIYNVFGIKFNENNIDESSPSFSTDPDDPIINGPFGKVTHFEYHGGATMIVDKSINSSAESHCWRNNRYTDSMIATSTYGYGKLVAYGDSSPVEDDTAHDGSTTYDGWIGDGGKKPTLNACVWLLQPAVSSNYTGKLSLDAEYYYGTNTTATITLFDEDLTNSSVNVKIVSLSDPEGINIQLLKNDTRYTGSFGFSISHSSFNKIKVRTGDKVTVIYTDLSPPTNVTTSIYWYFSPEDKEKGIFCIPNPAFIDSRITFVNIDSNNFSRIEIYTIDGLKIGETYTAEWTPSNRNLSPGIYLGIVYDKYNKPLQTVTMILYKR